MNITYLQLVSIIESAYNNGASSLCPNPEELDQLVIDALIFIENESKENE
jgi:hypothetical protein